MNNDLKYWVAFSQNPKIGPVRFRKILKFFGNLEIAWKATLSDFQKAGIEKDIAYQILNMQKNIDPDSEMEKLEKENIKAITFLDKEYPKLLKEIHSPPALLYIKGQFKKEDKFAISIVGARKATSYGRQITYEIAYNIAKSGLTIVSGLAIGIDTQAHKAVLDVGGRTIAVLACGLDNNSIYPSINRKLADQIANCGAVISEYPIRTPALRHYFPARNRIISGLSLGTLVTECAEKSGAQITVKHSLEQNREVFAIPGNIYSKNSIGPNNLIKMGAKSVTSFEDILDELNLNQASEYTKTSNIIPDTREETILLEFLNKEPVHVDNLVKKSKLDTAAVTSTLTLMEMKGKVKNLGGMQYIIGR